MSAQGVDFLHTIDGSIIADKIPEHPQKHNYVIDSISLPIECEEFAARILARQCLVQFMMLSIERRCNKPEGRIITQIYITIIFIYNPFQNSAYKIIILTRVGENITIVVVILT